ncbi:hypothetical protein ABT160_04695 [Streptomyces sp. NPDC001941]|uniref:hypothetical protein n=1 Tax=Streptomyces sp. NPDC001941 TaxID=3154659 RepID=UPI003332B17E
MSGIVEIRAVRGGFKAEREFGFALETRFPGIALDQVDVEGVALVVEISNPKRLNLYQLSRVLIGAANGGVKTAVISVRKLKLAAAVPLFNLFAMVDENAHLKEMYRLERLIKVAA